METPVFEEFDPESDCDCPGRAFRRRALPHSPVGRTAVHRILIIAAAASTALGAGHAVPALAAPHALTRFGFPAGDEPDTPQGGKAPLHGRAGTSSRPTDPVRTPPTTRAEIITRAREWVAAKVPYSMRAYWSDGYRQDCSGFVSMAWNLPGNEWTGSLHQYGERISKEELQPGDILLFHNPANPQNGSHVVLFGGWTDYRHRSYMGYEEARPYARTRATPYPYRSNSHRYVPYRYKGLTAEAAGEEPAEDDGTEEPTGGAGPADDGVTVTALSGDAAYGPGRATAVRVPEYPGRAKFRPGARNAYVTQLGRQLVKKGFGRYYTAGPGPRWGEADRRAVQAFQRTQGWRGGAADGYPGPETWRRLFS
ncbi:peptidoglycan-binding protein [Streptomyces sp. NPDC002888]|uniref:peptidoglycan-binding protein n=1 Tax=Streptomyces sp. NPDC002888 TaxID=3364668 RepID=UPI0036AA57B3